MDAGDSDVAWDTFPYMVERCEAKIENLMPGKKYVFRVRASNILDSQHRIVCTVSAQPALVDKIGL